MMLIYSILVTSLHSNVTIFIELSIDNAFLFCRVRMIYLLKVIADKLNTSFNVVAVCFYHFNYFF